MNKQVLAYKNSFINKVEDLSLNPNYKYCSYCNFYKLLDEFYSYRIAYKVPCITCQRRMTTARDNKIKESGFSPSSRKPGHYLNQQIKDDVFEIMFAMGWIYNDNGVFSKEGIKDKNNVWSKIKHKKK